MNGRQRKFAQLYSSDPNATQAAIRAGYSAKSAYSIGQENLKKPEIVEYIQELQAKSENERIASASEIKQFWTHILRDDNERTDHRLKASTLLARAAGLFAETMGVTTDVEIEDTPSVLIYLPDNNRQVITDLEEFDQETAWKAD